MKQDILGAVKPKNKAEVKQILQTAKENSLSLYPISTGNNWGYGAATPAKENCIILDLGDLQTISDYDDQTGSITIEPGVTQKILYDFLTKHGSKHLVPTTGVAGPSASILGNALERGYGITPETDHFNSIYEIEVLLPNGEPIHTGFTSYGADSLKGAFKCPPGPNLL